MRGLAWEVLLEMGELMVSFLLFLFFVAYLIINAYLVKPTLIYCIIA